MIKRMIVEIAPKTWLISDYKLANMYLLEGDEKALLIDTGSGLGPLEDEVRALTGKPLIVALTHGHGDHTGGCHLFEGPSLMHPADIELLEQMEKLIGSGDEFRINYVKTRGKVRNPEADEQELLALIREDGKAAYEPLADRERIELGGRTVEVIHTPGHSLGSVCFLDSKERLLFTGDTTNDCLLLNMPPYTTTVKGYYDSVKRLWDREAEFDHICLGHDAFDKEDKTYIKDYLEVTQMLLDGSIVGDCMDDGLHTGIGVHYNKVRIFYNPEYLV